MAHVRTFSLPHYPDYPVQVALFTNVTNAAFLRSQLLEANSDFDYAFLDASMVSSPIHTLQICSVSDLYKILSPHHLLSASFSALHRHATSTLKARTPHSELVFRLHPNNNIGESYRKFGISDTTTNLIAVKLSLPKEGSATSDITAESVSKHLGENVKGESIEIGEEGEELGRFADVEKIRGVYKLGDVGKGKGKKGVVNGGVVRDERKELEGVILGMMTIKGS